MMQKVDQQLEMILLTRREGQSTALETKMTKRRRETSSKIKMLAEERRRGNGRDRRAYLCEGISRSQRATRAEAAAGQIGGGGRLGLAEGRAHGCIWPALAGAVACRWPRARPGA